MRGGTGDEERGGGEKREYGDERGGVADSDVGNGWGGWGRGEREEADGGSDGSSAVDAQKERGASRDCGCVCVGVGGGSEQGDAALIVRHEGEGGSVVRDGDGADSGHPGRMRRGRRGAGGRGRRDERPGPVPLRRRGKARKTKVQRGRHGRRREGHAVAEAERHCARERRV